MAVCVCGDGKSTAESGFWAEGAYHGFHALDLFGAGLELACGVRAEIFSQCGKLFKPPFDNPQRMQRAVAELGFAQGSLAP